jgi:hypothetical protein
MAMDQLLAERVRVLVTPENAVEQTVPDGIGFVIHGITACGIYHEYLIVQVGEDRHDEFLTHPLARPMDLQGNPTPGWVGIVPTGTRRDVDLAGWVRTGVEFAKNNSKTQ